MSRADRARAKKKTHKLSSQQVHWIRCQKALGLSTRQAAKAFKLRYHYIHSVSPSTVWRIWNDDLHVATHCRICETRKGTLASGGVPFSVEPDLCDPCYKVMDTARSNAQERKDKTATRQRIINEVGEDPDLELVDLPHYLRRAIYNDENIDLTKEDLLRTPRTHKRSRSVASDCLDPATPETNGWFGAIYALHFVGRPELEKFVYVGMTTSGVLKRFAAHISDAKNEDRASSGTPYYRKVMTELDRTGGITDIRIQLLENLVYAPDVGHEEIFNEKEQRSFLESQEQKWQKRLFLSGYNLMNASFKINTSHPLYQDITRKELADWVANPEQYNITDLSNIGHGYYELDTNSTSGRKGWKFYKFEEGEGVSLYTEDTAGNSTGELLIEDIPELSILDEVLESMTLPPDPMPDWLL